VEVGRSTKIAVVKISNSKGYSDLNKMKDGQKNANCCQFVAKLKINR